MNIYQGTLILSHKEEVAKDTLKLKFRVETLQTLSGKNLDPNEWSFKPGQFISLGFDEKTWRAYSIASTPEEKEIELVVRLVTGGKGSIAFSEMKIDDKLNFKGGFGHFLLSENQNKLLVFCATGTGIAPLRSMILTENSKENPRDMILLYGGRNAEDISYLDEISTWAPNLKIYLGFSRDPKAQSFSPNAHHNRITKFLEDEVYAQNAEFYICGNGDMVKSVQEVLEAKSIEKANIFMERFN